MSLTDTQRARAARSLARAIFVRTNATAVSDLAGLKQAIANLDIAMEATTEQVQSARPGVKLKVALLQEATKDTPALTQQQAAVALILWAAEEAGLPDIV